MNATCIPLRRSAILAASLTLMASMPVLAQDASGSLYGQIVMADGVSIRVRNLDTQAVHNVTPDANGRYTLDGLAPGRYAVTISNASGRPATSEITVRAGERTQVPAQITAGTDDVVRDFDAVIARGIRGSLESAQDRKREASQILDAIVSEDVGKLPDNNVPEALSRVTGVQIDRVRGEGRGISIRGLGDIQTTVNGLNSSVGESRTTNLADIPAELLKSVEVYKTRTADQVEGGIAGTVNVELRRPFDLPEGGTLGGSLRTVYNNIGENWSPYASLLWSNRTTTQWGQIGFLLNGSFTRHNYEEIFIDSESPDRFCCEAFDKLPENMREMLAPFAANYGMEHGEIERPSINASLQFKPSDALELLLEGSYFGSKEKRHRNREWNYDVSDVVFTPDNRHIQSLVVTSPTGAISGGPESYYEQVDSDNYTSNFEVRWRGEQLDVRGSAQYNWSKTNYYGILQVMQLAGVNSARFTINSPNVPGGGPWIEYLGADLTDPSTYRMRNFHDEQTFAESDELASAIDLTWTPKRHGFVRSWQGGLRYSERNTERHYGYRDTLPAIPPSLTDFPTGSNAMISKPNLSGAAFIPTWYHLSGPDLAANWQEVMDYVGWLTPRPDDNRGQSYTSNEQTLAGYLQLNYGFNAGLPVDGTAGVRVVKTEGVSRSADYRPIPEPPFEDIRDSVGQGSYTDVIPSINTALHFTDKLKLRLAWTRNVQRPSFFNLRPFAFFETRANPPLVFAGNPDLRPNRETAWNLSLEYYFGRAGSASIAGYIKKPDGFLYYSGEEEYIPQLDTIGTVFKERNAGPGEFRGIEMAAQSFFDFLPGIWSRFGASANFTWLDKYEIRFPFTEAQSQIPDIFNAPGTSKRTYNLALYYDTPKFSARLAYNYRAKRKDWIWTPFPEYSQHTMATSRLDAALNYTPYKFVTFSLEATNLLDEDIIRYWGDTKNVPMGPRYEARTLQASVRMRWN